MDYYIGIDIGTTSTKTVAFSPDGAILASTSIPYITRHPARDQSEQDPKEIFEAVLDGLSQVIRALPESRPLLVSFSSAMHSLLAVDANGDPLTQCIIWADNRAAAVADRIHAAGLAPSFYNVSGVPVHAMSPLCKLIWLREQQPAIFAAAHRFIGIKEYVFFRLLSDYVLDTSVASASGLLDIRRLEWHQPLLTYAGVTTEQLSRLVPPGTAFKLHADFFRSHPSLASLLNTPFVIGGSDGGLANLGSGATAAHSMAINIGTSSAARIVVSKPVLDPHMRTFCYHLYEGQYFIGGAGNNGAVLLQWLRETLLQSHKSLEKLLAEASAIDPGADGLLVLPYLLGERAPLWDAHAKAVFFGLDVRHTQAHLVRAAMEAVVYSVYGTARILMEQTTITEIRATGGFTKTDGWVQILADVCNCPVLLSDAVEASALGAVMIGCSALELPPLQVAGTVRAFRPNAATHTVYAEGFAKMEKLYHLLRPEM